MGDDRASRTQVCLDLASRKTGRIIPNHNFLPCLSSHVALRNHPPPKPKARRAELAHEYLTVLTRPDVFECLPNEAYVLTPPTLPGLAVLPKPLNSQQRALSVRWLVRLRESSDR